jgi:hypothetical protein
MRGSWKNRPHYGRPLSFSRGGLTLLRRFRPARTVESNRLLNERFESGLVNCFSFVDVDRAAYVRVETRVEETGRIPQRRALGEGKLHDVLVGLASADDAVVRPDRGAGLGWFNPLPLLEDVRVCFLDEVGAIDLKLLNAKPLDRGALSLTYAQRNARPADAVRRREVRRA